MRKNTSTNPMSRIFPAHRSSFIMISHGWMSLEYGKSSCCYVSLPRTKLHTNHIPEILPAQTGRRLTIFDGRKTSSLSMISNFEVPRRFNLKLAVSQKLGRSLLLLDMSGQDRQHFSQLQRLQELKSHLVAVVLSARQWQPNADLQRVFSSKESARLNME